MLRAVLAAAGIAAFCFVASSASAQDGGHIKTAPPLTAAEQLTKFRLPPGFTIQLVAAEPEVRKPINIAFDAAGRLYATQSIEYPYAQAEPDKRRDYVSRYEIGLDGRAASSRVVVRGLNIPIGITPIATAEGREDLLVFSIPELLRCRDTDGDGEFETKTPILRGFGQRDTHGLVNGLTPWIDGWVYACHGFSNESRVVGTDGSTITMQSGNTFRFKPDGSRVEHFTHGQVNPFGMTFDALGNVFTADCHTLPAYNLIRGACYPSFGRPHDGLGFGPAMMKHQHGSTGISGIVCYEADQFPEAYRGTLFIGNPITARINHDKLVPHGATFEAVEQPDFLICDDPWFRPVDIKLGPDGALYVADFYNRIIGHYEVPLDHPQRDRERGRIWRIVYTGEGATLPTNPNVAGMGFVRLLEQTLTHPNLVVRTMAINRLAVERPTEFAASRFVDLLEAKSEPIRIGAMYLLARRKLEYMAVPEMADILSTDTTAVQVHFWKVLGDSTVPEHREQLAQIAPGRLAAVKSPEVLRAMAEALGRSLGDPRLIDPLLEAWSKTPAEDTHTIHVLRIALREQLRDDKVLAATQARLDEPQIAKLAEIVVAVPTTSAAAWLNEYLKHRAPPHGMWSPIVEHLAKHTPTDEWPAVESSLTKHRNAPLPMQADIIRAAYRGLQSRGVAPSSAITGWADAVVAALIIDVDAARVRLGLDLVRELKPPTAFEETRRLVESTTAADDLRAAALDACTACDAGRAVALMESLLVGNINPALRTKAHQMLGTLRRDDARRLLAARLQAAPERIQLEIALALAATDEGAELLLASLEAGKASARLLGDLDLQRRLDRVNVRDRRERVAKLTVGLPPIEEQLAKLVEARRSAFAKLEPDRENGRAVFRKTCAACHKLGGEGNKVGPELDGIGRRGLDRLLEDLLDPNRNVDQAFRATTFTTVDGRIVTGLVLRREGATFVLVDAQGKELRLAESDVEESTQTLLSPMPSNIAASLPEADFLNLVGFLLTEPGGGAQTVKP